MLNKYNIRDLVSKMTKDLNSNIRKIKTVFGSIEYIGEENQSLLHIYHLLKYAIMIGLLLIIQMVMLKYFIIHLIKELILK